MLEVSLPDHDARGVDDICAINRRSRDSSQCTCDVSHEAAEYMGLGSLSCRRCLNGRLQKDEGGLENGRVADSPVDQAFLWVVRCDFIVIEREEQQLRVHRDVEVHRARTGSDDTNVLWFNDERLTWRCNDGPP